MVEYDFSEKPEDGEDKVEDLQDANEVSSSKKNKKKKKKKKGQFNLNVKRLEELNIHDKLVNLHYASSQVSASWNLCFQTEAEILV